jgi:hypothetical protein
MIGMASLWQRASGAVARPCDPEHLMRDEGAVGVVDRGASSRAAARTRMAAWLLDGPAQLRDGTHAGGVAGCVQQNGAPVYVYPEITGYYLQWLAWRASQGDAVAQVRPRAVAAQAWLARWSAEPPPLTRVHLQTTPDWRNDATFTFDVAMVLRGIASAALTGLVEADAALVARLDAQLLAAVGEDGLFDPYRPHPDAPPLPPGWATRRGAFLAKAAAGVLAAAEVCAVAPLVRLAAAVTLEETLEEASRAPHAQLHPRLYALEGALAKSGSGTNSPISYLTPILAGQVAALIDTVAHAGGSDHAHGAHRLDVRAQALRIGCALRALDVEDAPTRAALVTLADSLAAAATSDGALPVAAGDRTRNVWTAMFAEQALGWLDGACDPQWLV